MRKLITILITASLVVALSSFDDPPAATKTLGVFQAIKMMVYDDTTLTMSTVSAITTLFEDPSIAGLPPYNRINDGDVKLNTSSLFFRPEINMYLDSAKRTGLDTVNWSLTGSSLLSDFSFMTSHPIPAFQNVGAIPITISRSQDYTIVFGTLAGVDEIEFTIDDSQAYTSMPWYRRVPGDIGTLTIPQSDLPDFSATDVCVRVTFIAEEEKEFNGKKYMFENRLQVIKKVTFVP